MMQYESTILMGACNGKNLDTVKMLLKRGADVTCSTIVRGVSFIARRYQLLSTVDANTLFVQNGNTALHLAAYSGARNELLHALIDAGANIEVKNVDGKTAADYARDRGHVVAAEFLDSFLRPITKSANLVV
jgi:ankyrin repeat protein